MKKICTKCHQEKDLTEFYKSRRVKDGRRADCGECNKKSVIERTRQNPEKSRERSRNWRKENPERVFEQRKKRLPISRERTRERYNSDPEFREKRLNEVRAYRADPKNKKALQETSRNGRKRQMQDPKFRIAMNLRRRMNTVLKNFTKDSSTIKLVGCTWEEFRAHIESQFVDGMSWENYGRFGWHVDHIKSCAKFDLSDPAQQKECFHYTNLQPLWWQDNLLKKDMSMEDFLLKKEQKSFD